MSVMEKSNFHQKYSGTVLNHPPASRRVVPRSPAVTGDDEHNTAKLDDHAVEQEGHFNDHKESRPGSRACTPREDRIGIINQYRKPWIRPQTAGCVTTSTQRERQMVKYRQGRPKSSPVARRHRSPDREKYGYAIKRPDSLPSRSRPGSSRPGSRLSRRMSSSISRRRDSTIDSDVEEIIVGKSKGVGQESRTITGHRDGNENDIKTNNHGWTRDSGSTDTKDGKTDERRIPTLTTRARMHVTADVDDRSNDVEKTENDTKVAIMTKIVEPEVEPQDETSNKTMKTGDENRKQSVFDVTMMAAVSPGGMAGSRARSLSSASTDGRSSPSPSRHHGESVVRRARKERLKRLTQYRNTRFNRPAETAREKLLRVCKTVRVIAGICLAMKSYVKDEATKQWSLHEMHLNLRADLEQNLAFDLIMFSKLRVTRGSEKLKNILSLRPEQRTRADIEVVLALLRKNKAFTEYQQETQVALAKYMEYLRFEPRRIVVKEGHVASGFYIILSGTCLVNQKENDPRNGETFVRTITQLTTGESFGEYSLLHNTVRSASVVCKDEVEVLLINKDDFDNIIKRPLEQKRDELIEFCHSHDIYISATQETLKNQPKAIYTKFFKPGIVITEDIMSSEYIYVVKEGKCTVVAEIREMKPLPRKGQLPDRYFMHDESWKKDAAIKRSMAVLSAGKRRSWSAAARNKLYPPEKKEKNFFSMNAMNVEDTTNDYIEDRRKSVQMATKESPRYLLKDDQMITTKKKEIETESKSVGLQRTWRRVTMSANALSQKEEKKNPVEYAPPGKIKTTFARLATLKTGMAFGIESLLPGTQPEAKLCLISDGAEVILVSKRLFASDVTSTTLKTASKLAVDYPSIDFTREVLEEARTWATYKNRVIKEIYSKKLEKRPVQPRR
ncbi:uncharacterized protein LOC121407181 isoform X1 [Lytechinus variegatus]|uniref:uncharacterized protein LOC121407181 isoform X1 n=1 Tax=Lytechinus variegatus TaxID=7654 RepID=UPI001BB194F2|nr:uncharacterized protein LOC121407181 isoform X1 [Lytechinus variegatus]